MHGLDLLAIQIPHEGTVVAGAVLGSWSRWTLWRGPLVQGCGIPGVYLVRAVGKKRDVDAVRCAGRLSINGGLNPELRKIASVGNRARMFHHAADAERAQGGIVERHGTLERIRADRDVGEDA